MGAAMMPLELLNDDAITQLVMTVFGAGLVTGLMIFLLSFGLSSALRILKTI
jgi:hypothetical protein